MEANFKSEVLQADTFLALQQWAFSRYVRAVCEGDSYSADLAWEIFDSSGDIAMVLAEDANES